MVSCLYLLNIANSSLRRIPSLIEHNLCLHLLNIANSSLRRIPSLVEHISCLYLLNIANSSLRRIPSLVDHISMMTTHKYHRNCPDTRCISKLPRAGQSAMLLLLEAKTVKFVKSDHPSRKDKVVSEDRWSFQKDSLYMGSTGNQTIVTSRSMVFPDR